MRRWRPLSARATPIVLVGASVVILALVALGLLSRGGPLHGPRGPRGSPGATSVVTRHPVLAPRLTVSVTGASGAGATVTTPLRTDRHPSRPPHPTPRVTVTRTRPAPEPHPTRPPRRPSPHPTPAPSTPHPLGSVVCGVLGLLTTCQEATP